MKKYLYKNFTNGWLIGNFVPSIFKSKDVEVGLKYYNKNDFEKKHVHKLCTEITVIIYGKVKMSENIYQKGDIIKIEPGIPTDFLAIEDTATLVIKTPSEPKDKYYV